MSDEALENLKRKKLEELAKRPVTPSSSFRKGMRRRQVVLCMGCCCPSNGSAAVYRRLVEEVHNQDLDESVRVSTSGCQGPCEVGPNMIVYPEVTQYSRVTVGDVKEIVTQHLKDGKIVSRLLMHPQAQGSKLPMLT